MSVKEEKFCRLCFRAMDIDYEDIDDATKMMLDNVLYRNINWNLSEDPVICGNCSETATKCYYFKMSCIDGVKWTESGLNDAEICHNSPTIDNQDSFTLCVFCMNQVKSCISMNFLSNDPKIVEILPKIMPEMDLEAITSLYKACASCAEKFENYIKFILNCYDTEEKINIFFQDRASNSHTNQVKLRNIHDALFRKSLGSPSKYTQENEIKQESHSFEEYPAFETVKIECEINIKDEDVYSESLVGSCHEDISEAKTYKCDSSVYETRCAEYLPEKHALTDEDISNLTVYKCPRCTFETKYRAYFMTHALLHKDPSDIRMYKCDSCTYESKFKHRVRIHEQIHKTATDMYISDENLYKCDCCPYKSKNVDLFTAHIQIHKDISEMKTYKCTNLSHQPHANPQENFGGERV